MERPAPESTSVAPTAPEATTPPERDWYVWKLAGQTLLGVSAFVGLMLFVSSHYRPQLEAFGGGFVDRFGLPGIFVAILFTDTFSSPLPPQFFIYSSISHGASHVAAMVTICTASILAGNIGYRFAQALSNARLLRPLVLRTRPKVEKLFDRYGYWGVALGAVLPIPYSILCYMSGLYRMPKRLFALLLLLRIPRLLFFYFVIRYTML